MFTSARYVEGVLSVSEEVSDPGRYVHGAPYHVTAHVVAAKRAALLPPFDLGHHDRDEPVLRNAEFPRLGVVVQMQVVAPNGPL